MTETRPAVECPPAALHENCAARVSVSLETNFESLLRGGLICWAVLRLRQGTTHAGAIFQDAKNLFPEPAEHWSALPKIGHRVRKNYTNAIQECPNFDRKQRKISVVPQCYYAYLRVKRNEKCRNGYLRVDAGMTLGATTMRAHFFRFPDVDGLRWSTRKRRLSLF